MHTKSIQTAKKIFQGHQGTLRTAQALRLGIQPRTLYQMRDSGLLVQESRGIYRLADSPAWSNPDLALVALRIPKGVICLVSALHFHGLTTQIPRQVDMALLQNSEKPRLEYPPVRYVWMNPPVVLGGDRANQPGQRECAPLRCCENHRGLLQIPQQNRPGCCPGSLARRAASKTLFAR